MEEKNLPLRDQMPKEFYNLFQSKNLNSFMDCLLAIYNAIVNETSFAVKGISVSDCIYYANQSVSSSVFDDDQLLSDFVEGEFQSKHLSALVKWGWLTRKYDSDTGLDLITIPEYSRLYIEVFKKLSEDSVAGPSSIRNVFSALSGYKEVSGKDESFLADAYDAAKGLNVSLSSYSDRIRSQLDMLFREKDGNNLIHKLYEYLLQNDKTGHSDISKRGHFLAMGDATVTIIDELMDLVLTDIEKVSEPESEADERRYVLLRRHYEQLKDIKNEVRRAMGLYREIIALSSDLCIRAERRWKILNSATSEIAAKRFDRLLVKLAHEVADGENSLAIKCANEFAFYDDSPFFMDKYPYTPPGERGTEPPLYVGKKEDRAAATPAKFIPKYSKRELRDFEQSHSVNGVFHATKDNIQTPEDLDKLIHLYLRAMENDLIKVIPGKVIRKGEDFAYSELQWKAIDNEDEF